MVAAKEVLKMNRTKVKTTILYALIATWTGTSLLVREAAPQTPFYQGKTIKIIDGSPAGGTGDLRTKTLIPFLQKHIPGNPFIVVEYMPGGGGRKAANYLYNIKSDGLTIGNPGTGFVPSAVLGETGVTYNVDKFTYLGATNSRTNFVLFTNKEAGWDTLEKLRAASGVRFGAHSVGHSVYVRGRMFAWLLGLKDPKFVTGYSGAELRQAIFAGEFDAQAYNSDIFVKRLKEWVDKELVHFHVVDEIPQGYRFRYPAFDALPTLGSFAKSDKVKKVLEMHHNFTLIGSPFILPPDTPKEQLQILSEAMRKTFRDPAFVPTFTKMTGAEPSPLFPDEQAKAIKEIPRDPETVSLFKAISGPDPLPAR
jgi:tripartite-type tricarboxylate transporter receptor subunit TctC